MLGPPPREGVASFPGIARPNRALHEEDTSRHTPKGAPRLVFGHIELNVDIRRCVLLYGQDVGHHDESAELRRTVAPRDREGVPCQCSRKQDDRRSYWCWSSA